jgi:hypothetical protein
MSRDLTVREARKALDALRVQIGPNAEVYVSIVTAKHRHHGLSAQLYPSGIMGKVSLFVTGDTLRELVTACQEKWAEHVDLHATNIRREMALAIIAITADLGECTDAALRAKFDAEDVARHGDAAVEQANAMAANGPFSIVRLSGANDAEAA